MNSKAIEELLFDKLTKTQRKAVSSEKRQVLVVAGAGSGKTEVMARRIAWWVGIESVPKDKIVAFTFTDRAAEEMKFRIRGWIERITPEDQEVYLGDMYVGTIHGYCLAKLREFWPDRYHNYDILDDGARTALVLRGFDRLLGLNSLQSEIRKALEIKRKKEVKFSRYATLESFTKTYDQLQEHNLFEILEPTEPVPSKLGEVEHEWCKLARLITEVGQTPRANAFASSAARYYAYLKCRHFLDFSTSQTEFIRTLKGDTELSSLILSKGIHLVVDEVQDVNPVQGQLVQLLVGPSGKLTAVGDHRQSIYGFRGAKVEIIAKLWEELKRLNNAEVIDLQENFRSTPRIVKVANSWADTISPLLSMKTPEMKHGNKDRVDFHDSHVALVGFPDRRKEASWIAEAIKILVPPDVDKTARHDKKGGNGQHRGLTYSDIAILVRTSTDVRTYMDALDTVGIPSIVRAGPDLFSQPEVLLMVSALAITAKIDLFLGSEFNKKSLPSRISDVLACEPMPMTVLKESAKRLRGTGLEFDRDSEERLLFASQAIHQRISDGRSFTADEVSGLRTKELREFLESRNKLRRVFPQKIYHMLLSEAGVDKWDTCEGKGQAAMFHLGALSKLVTEIETPGWTSATDYHWQIIGLCQYGSEEGRTEEQPLLVTPDAITISTIHGAKGLEYAAVFLADVNASRFPNSKARQIFDHPLDGNIVKQIDIAGLADNENHDGERRLLYVALTRAERYLLISHSGDRTSSFIKELRAILQDCGGTVTDDSKRILKDLEYSPKEHKREVRLCTSFSDLRYYIECPHDFYLRKVLGFAPTIDQAFGYGRGVHNLLRAVHSNPKRWAELAKDRDKLEKEINRLIEGGLFYLRYTTGEPADNMRSSGMKVVADYIQYYENERNELSTLEFEPERTFETLIEYEDGNGGAMISGAIDVVRRDNPPRVTLIDFKSGEPESDKHKSLDEEEMKLQVAVYAIAAKKELEYQPDLGLVRYLGASGDNEKELNVTLTEEKLNEAGKTVSEIANRIRNREFKKGPAPRQGWETRCDACDHHGFCGTRKALKD